MSKELPVANSASGANKVTNGAGILFNGINGNPTVAEASSPANVSIIGTGSDTLMNTLTGGSSGQSIDTNVFLNPQNLMSYSPFASVDGSWTTPTAAYDPSLLTAFGFTGAGIMSGQALNPYFFPGTGTDLTGAGIWGQEATGAASNPLMLGSFMMNPLIDHQQQAQQQQLSNSDVVAMGDGNATASNTIDSVVSPFSALTVNGSGGVSDGMSLEQQAVAGLDTSGVVPGPVEEPTETGTSVTTQNSAPRPEKPKSWAAIASQPAKPRPPPAKPEPQPEMSSESSALTSRKSSGSGRGGGSVGGPQGTRNQGGVAQSGSGKGSGSRRTQGSGGASQGSVAGGSSSKGAKSSGPSELVGKLKSEKNPGDLTINTVNARFFVIKSYAEDDIHRSIKYDIWTSTEHGNRRLDQAFREQKGRGGIYLLFSVNGSGHFCGVAQMTSEVDFNTVTGVWAQDKWKGSFSVKWIYVKDVPNSQLRHIRLENNENKPVTNSRDTQEVPLAKARQVIKIIHSYQHKTSIFDDFDHYEKKQEEDKKQAT